MNTLATRYPLVLATIRATVTANGTTRCTWLTATVITVPTYSAAPMIQYVRTCFLMSSASECIVSLHNHRVDAVAVITTDTVLETGKSRPDRRSANTGRCIQ